MDAALLATSASLSVYLPKCAFGYRTRAEQLSMALSISLSLGLFSLSILEAAPPSWLIFFSHEEMADREVSLTGGVLSISKVYWVFFWALSLVILLVFPSLAGASLADSFRDFCCSRKTQDHDNQKYNRWKQAWRSSPWWIRFLGGLVSIVTRNLWRFFERVCWRRRRQPTELVMSRTLSEDEMRTVSNSDAEFHGLVAPNNAATGTNSRSSIWMVIGGIAGICSVLVMVSSIGPLVVHTSTGMTALSVVVSWLSAIGLLISSLLNGFGSVSMPYSCLVGIYLTPVRPEVITKLESELQSVRDAMATKRGTLRESTMAIKQGTNTGTGPKQKQKTFSNATSRGFGDIGEELGNRRQVLQTEIEFLESLCKDMKADIEELRYSKMLAAAARTTMGKVRSYVGLLFSIILLVRLGSAGLNIWQSYSSLDTSRRKVAHGDVVTTGLLWLGGHDIVSQKDFTMLSQAVSLCLTALLTFTQVRTFFRIVASVHRRLSRFYQKCYCGTFNTATTSNIAASDERAGLSALAPGLFSQVVAGATGCYFLSCIVLIKMMLPEEFCEDFASAMGGTDVFTIHMPVVNTVFASSAGISLAILAMLFGIQRQNTLRHTSASNEGMVLRGADAV